MTFIDCGPNFTSHFGRAGAAWGQRLNIICCILFAVSMLTIMCRQSAI